MRSTYGHVHTAQVIMVEAGAMAWRGHRRRSAALCITGGTPVHGSPSTERVSGPKHGPVASSAAVLTSARLSAGACRWDLATLGARQAAVCDDPAQSLA